MDYPIQTLSQLRPILQGFRKAAGLTQAGMAALLGVTQQAYAQLEANPAAASVERLFKVLRLLDVDMTLGQSERRQQTAAQGNFASPSASAKGSRAPLSKATGTSEPRHEPRAAKTLQTARRGPDRSRKGSEPAHEKTKPARKTGASAVPARAASRTGTVKKKRENW